MTDDTIFKIIFLLCSPSSGFLRVFLEETAILQVFFDDDVGYGIEHKLDVLCVGSAGHVRVDFFDVPAQVQVQELHLDIVTSILIGIGAWVRQCNYKVLLLLSLPLS